jgi:hypothetical protein
VIPALIGLFFGFLWLLIGISGLHRSMALAVLAGGVLIFAIAAWRAVRRGTCRNRFDRRYYVVAVVAEIAAIAAAQYWLSVHGRNDLLFPIVGVIVGLHFIGLWLAATDRRYLWLAGALVAINLAGLLPPLSQGGRAIVSGFGSSLALLVTASA